MKISVHDPVHLLHACPWGTLATLSTQVPGYPFATVLPFVPDERHQPVFLVSGLAEHTRNLLADGRASLALALPDGDKVQTGPRLTLVGDALPVEASALLKARFLRYAPDAERYLALGDFGFFRLAVQRLRYVAGFGRMGWIGQQEWQAGPFLSLEDEAELLARLVEALPAGVRLLGIDCRGLDLERDGIRSRLPFPAAVCGGDALETAVRQVLAA